MKNDRNACYIRALWNIAIDRIKWINAYIVRSRRVQLWGRGWGLKPASGKIRGGEEFFLSLNRDSLRNRRFLSILWTAKIEHASEQTRGPDPLPLLLVTSHSLSVSFSSLAFGNKRLLCRLKQSL